ncbi:MAG: lysophospholipid acyltransferase family protein [Planctomycetota bacterium]
MSDLFYRVVVKTCSQIGHVATRPRVVGREHAERPGGYLLATNHTSPMDVPVLMYTTPRLIDFVSVVEVMGVPVVGAFYRRFNTITLDRGRVDAAAVRTIVSRLRAGRVVCMFPEGRITPEAESVTRGGTHRAGLGRVARLAGVPVLPAVVLDSHRMTRPAAWLPTRRSRFTVAYGEALHVREDLPPREAQRDLEARWRDALRRLAERHEQGR